MSLRVARTRRDLAREASSELETGNSLRLLSSWHHVGRAKSDPDCDVVGSAKYFHGDDAVVGESDGYVRLR